MVGVARRCMNFFEQAMDISIFRGIATKKTHMGKGYASILIKHILYSLYKEGRELAVLKTYIHPFYERLGFYTCSRWDTVEVPYERQADAADYRIYQSVHMLNQGLLYRLFACYRCFTSEKNLFLQRDIHDMESILEEALDVSGEVLVICQSGENICGYCIGSLEGSALFGNETVYVDSGALSAFAAAARKLGKQAFRYKSFDLGTHEDAMVRAVSVEKLLHKAHMEEGELCIKIEDPILPENSGIWQVICHNKKVSAKKCNGTADAFLTSGELACLVLGAKITDEKIPENISTLFKKREVGIFEQY